jgi:hypothetical protein
LTSVIVRFQSDNSRQVRQLNDALRLLTCDRPIAHESGSKTHTCRNRVQQMLLQPILVGRTKVDRPPDAALMQLFAQTWLSIEQLLLTSRRPTHFSIGCLETLLPGLSAFMHRFCLPEAQQAAATLKSLDLCSVKANPHFYPVHRIPDTSFASFRNLTSLSIDYDQINSVLIRSLVKSCLQLIDLSLHVHGLDAQHEIVPRRVWDLFLQRSNASTPEVSVHMLHTHDQPIYLLRLLRNLSLPLVRLSAYFVISGTRQPLPDGMLRADESRRAHRYWGDVQQHQSIMMMGAHRGHSCVGRLLELLGTQHQNSLKELRLVEKPLRYEFAWPYATFSSMHENALVMLAWRCRSLEKLVVIGKCF